MNIHLHVALQSAQWACGSILGAEFYRTHMDPKDHLSPVHEARRRLMDALDRLSTYEAELKGELNKDVSQAALDGAA